MLSTVKQRFFLIAGLLFILSGAGCIGALLFLDEWSSSARRGELAALTDRTTRELEQRFWEIRFWEQAALSQNRPDAEQRFAVLLNETKASIQQLNPEMTSVLTQAKIEEILKLLVDYDGYFSQLIQLQTQQRLNKTDFDSNYQVLASNIFPVPDAQILYKPLFNLNRFQENYFFSRSESKRQSLNIAFDSLLGSVEQSSLHNDLRFRSYMERYQEVLQRDFDLENEIRILNQNSTI